MSNTVWGISKPCGMAPQGAQDPEMKEVGAEEQGLLFDELAAVGIPGIAVGDVAIGVADDENGQAQVGKRHKREQIDRAHVNLLKRRSGWPDRR